MEEVEIKESISLDNKKPVIINGLPEIGLVGSIASMHLIDSLKLKDVGFLKSDLFSPVVVIHNKRPLEPARIYANDSMVLFLSEIALPPEAIYPLTKTLIDWYEEKDPEIVVFLGGFPVSNRETIEEPKIIGVASDEKSEEILNKNGIEILEEGFIAGPYGLLVNECRARGIPAIYLMSEAHLGIPDPEAAASVIKALNNIFDLNVDVAELIKKGEEIRVMSRDLMKRTEESMRKMEKNQEHELPPMYS